MPEFRRRQSVAERTAASALVQQWCPMNGTATQKPQGKQRRVVTQRQARHTNPNARRNGSPKPWSKRAKMSPPECRRRFAKRCRQSVGIDGGAHVVQKEVDALSTAGR